MVVTPTATSGFLSGAGLWSLFWSMVCKVDSILSLCGMRDTRYRDDVFEWVKANKAVTIIGTEVANLMMHLKALSSPNLMAFVLGGTMANIAWIFGIIPGFQAVFGGKRDVIG